MNKQYLMVEKFHYACGVEMPHKPTMLSRGNQAQSLECVRFGQRLEHISNLMKETGPTSPVLVRAAYMLEELSEFLYAETIHDQADALTDMNYFNLGTFTLMGVNPEPIFDIVANANLGKISPDGTVIRDSLGKIRKPDGWQEQYAPEPKIMAEIEQQEKTALCLHCKGSSQKLYGLECPFCN